MVANSKQLLETFPFKNNLQKRNFIKKYDSNLSYKSRLLKVEALVPKWTISN